MVMNCLSILPTFNNDNNLSYNKINDDINLLTIKSMMTLIYLTILSIDINLSNNLIKILPSLSPLELINYNFNSCSFSCE